MKLIVIAGQTSTGKSDLAVEIAKTLEGTIIVSADSRQVYKELNLLSGKVEGGWVNGVYLYKGIQHFLLDSVSLSGRFSVYDFVQEWIKIISETKATHVILVGGTGLYIKAVLEEYTLNTIDESLEKSINVLSDVEVLEQLQAKFFTQLSLLNASDRSNKRRLRSLLKRCLSTVSSLNYPKFDTTISLCLTVEPSRLSQRILQRIQDRMEQGMVEEMMQIEQHGEKLLTLGLESKYVLFYLRGLLTKEELVNQLWFATLQFAKRQQTWNKKQSFTTVSTFKECVDNLRLAGFYST
jgi:tRNA dimethylallyltransferase